MDEIYFSAFVRERRKQVGTLKVVSELMGCYRLDMLARLETGDVTSLCLKPLVIRALADVLGIEYDLLFRASRFQAEIDGRLVLATTPDVPWVRERLDGARIGKDQRAAIEETLHQREECSERAGLKRYLESVCMISCDRGVQLGVEVLTALADAYVAQHDSPR